MLFQGKIQVFYKFAFTNCIISHVGQTCRHLATRIDEISGRDKESYIYQPLMSFKDCFDKCFSVLDTANTKHQLRIIESLYIT